MSTFGGRMEEYCQISLDRFDGGNLNSTVYMLSHNHKDHTVGLNTTAFQYRLSTNSTYKLYCSAVTRDLLLLSSHYQPIKKSIIALDIDRPYVISVPNTQGSKVEEQQVTVTLLQAGHCPGSVMFLIEGEEGTVLYTGDFRLGKEELFSFNCLRDSNRVRDIRSVYVDTTFVVPEALYIPRREESNEAAIRLVQEWIEMSDFHVVLLKYKADIGYENLFIRLSQHFNMKIHVDEAKYEQSKYLDNMTEYLTRDPTITKIHACRFGWRTAEHRKPPREKQSGGCLPCGHTPPDKSTVFQVRTILFSTMAFIQRVGLESFVKRINERFHRVCYSFHSSYSEVRDMILYLRPTRAFANVIPAYEHTGSTMQDRLNSFVKLAHTISETPSKLVDSSSQINECPALGTLKSPKKYRRTPNKKSGTHADHYEDKRKYKRARTSSIGMLNSPNNHSVDSKNITSQDAKQSPVEDAVKFRLLFGCSDSSENTDGRLLSDNDVGHDSCPKAVGGDVSDMFDTRSTDTDSTCSDNLSLHSCSEEISLNNIEDVPDPILKLDHIEECSEEISLNSIEDVPDPILKFNQIENEPNQILKFQQKLLRSEDTLCATSKAVFAQRCVTEPVEAECKASPQDCNQRGTKCLDQLAYKFNSNDTRQNDVHIFVEYEQVQKTNIRDVSVTENISITIATANCSQNIVPVKSNTVEGFLSRRCDDGVELSFPPSTDVLLLDSQKSEGNNNLDDNVIVIDDDDECVKVLGNSARLHSTPIHKQSPQPSFTVDVDSESSDEVLQVSVSSCSQNSNATTVDIGCSPQKLFHSSIEDKSTVQNIIPIHDCEYSPQKSVMNDVPEGCIVNCLSSNVYVTENDKCVHDTKVQFGKIHSKVGKGYLHSTVGEKSEVVTNGRRGTRVYSAFKHLGNFDISYEESSDRSKPHDCSIRRPSGDIESSCKTISVIALDEDCSAIVDNNSDSLFSDSSQ